MENTTQKPYDHKNKSFNQACGFSEEDLDALTGKLEAADQKDGEFVSNSTTVENLEKTLTTRELAYVAYKGLIKPTMPDFMSAILGRK